MSKSYVNTPWGPSQGEEELAPGIMGYSTSSHGGIRLSPERQAQLRKAQPDIKNFLKSWQWWEEDCDWAVPYFHFRREIEAHGKAYNFPGNIQAAERTVRQWHPEYKF